jgi:thymidylate synthase (methanogen type)
LFTVFQNLVVFVAEKCMFEKMKNLVGSNGELGWPVAARDRIAFPHHSELRVTEANVGLTFLWTVRDSVLPKLDQTNLAIATNFYTPAGLGPMIRNILANPYIRYIILFGEEYLSKEISKGGELTSANAIRAFFERGINKERKLDGFGNAVYIDKNIPLEAIELIRRKVDLVDLNRYANLITLEDKIAHANDLILDLDLKPAFAEPMVFDYEKVDAAFPYEGGPLVVHGENIPDAWIKMIGNIWRYGRTNYMNANTDRLVKEINDMVVVIHDPQDMDLSINPFLIPLTPEKIAAYNAEILSPLLPPGKAYTYGNKLRGYSYPAAHQIKALVSTGEYKDFEFQQGPWLDQNVNYVETACEINQIQDIIDVLRRDKYSKACVAITWHPADELMRKHKSSPCLVSLQALVQDEKLNLTVFFRSHDMTQGWPENAYGCAAIQAEIAQAIGLPTGLLKIISGSAQIYNNYFKQVSDMLKIYSASLKSCTDARGNYQIELKAKNIVVSLMHPESGVVLEKYVGKTAYDLRDKIAVASLPTAHAIYLGTELAIAELKLRAGESYEQDTEFKSSVLF